MFLLRAASVAVICLFPLSSVGAEQRTPGQAYLVAQRLVKAHIKAHGDWGGSAFACPGGIETVEEESGRLGYFIDVQPQGYIMVTADDRLYPVRAYATISPSEPSAARVPLETGAGRSEIMQFLAKDIRRSFQPSSAIAEETHAKPGYPGLSSKGAAWDADLVIGPLLSSVWHQQAPFNAQLPLIENEPAQAGCGTIAMAQLLYFWKHPKRILKPHRYEWEEKLLQITDTSPYVWELMKEDYGYWGFGTPAEIEAVSRLVRDLAITLEARFSSSNTSTTMPGIEHSLRTFFDYSEDIDMVIRSDMTAVSLMREVILPELQKGQPVIYSIYEWDFSLSPPAHAVVADGYERFGAGGEFEFIHANFGWGNMWGSDSWYHPDRIVVRDRSYDWLVDQRIIRNLRPFVGRTEWETQIIEQSRGITEIQSDQFTALGIDAHRIIIVYDGNPERYTEPHWRVGTLDPLTSTMSGSIPLSLGSGLPILVKVAENAYALVYHDALTIDFQVRNYNGFLWNLSSSPVSFAGGPYAATSYRGNLVIAATRYDWGNKPFLHVYDINGDAGKSVDLDSTALPGSLNKVMIMPLTNGMLLTIFYTMSLDGGVSHNTLYAYLVDSELAVRKSRIELVRQERELSFLNCDAVGGGFVCVHRDFLTTKILGRAWDNNLFLVQEKRTLENYPELPTAPFDLAPMSRGQFLLAADDEKACSMQLYDLFLNRIGYPIEVPTDTNPSDNAIQTLTLLPNRYALFWLMGGDDQSTPGRIAYAVFKTSNGKHDVASILLLLLD